MNALLLGAFVVLVAAIVAYGAAVVIVGVLDRLGLVYDPNREDARHPAPFSAELLDRGSGRPPVAVGPGRPATRPRTSIASGRR